MLDKSLAGQRDIDLLVDIDRLSDFEAVLQQHRFVEFVPPTPSTRCIRHYYRLEEADAKILHIHVYYRIITGESQFKNYQLPIEKALLQSSFTNHHQIKEANPHHQHQLYTVRQFIKGSSLPSLLTVLRDRDDYSAELSYIADLINQAGNSPATDLGLSSSHVLQNSLKSKWLAGVATRRRFKSYRLRTGLSAIAGSYGGVFELVIRRLLRKKGKRCNGMIVSLVGLDGSGKSSAVDDLCDLFGSVLSVRKMHFGRPPSTLLTFPASIALKVYKQHRKPGLQKKKTDSNRNTGIVQALRSVSLAKDRCQVMNEANKLRGKGFLVIMDRCPVSTVGCMDAPRIVYEGKSSIMKWLMSVEHNYYLRMASVDHAIFMKASVDTAIARNHARTKSDKETDEEIRERFRQNEHAQFSATKVHEINTEKDLPAVRREVRKFVWNLVSSSN
jgi:thymidylate kinase